MIKSSYLKELEEISLKHQRQAEKEKKIFEQALI